MLQYSQCLNLIPAGTSAAMDHTEGMGTVFGGKARLEMEIAAEGRN